MEYGAVLRAQVHAEALGLNPLENGEEGVSQLPKSGWSCWERKKREKGKKQALSSREYKKRFLLDHTFYLLSFHKKSILFHLRSQNLCLSGKKFPQDGLFRGENFLQNFLPFSGLFLRGRRSKGVKRGAVKKCPYGVCPYGVCP